MRTRVYVDGFNLYYGALKGTSFKWLNLVELARQLLPGPYSVDKLNYFTARVSGVSDPGAPARQHAYLRALGTLPEVQVHFGSFLAKSAWRPLTNLPVAGRLVRICEVSGDSAMDWPEPGWIYHPWTRWPLLGNQTMSTTLDRITPRA